MFFQHVYDKTLAQSSYFIGCQAKKEAIVIDAQRDIDVYLKIAEQNDMQIRYVAETHIHADFLCGSRELAITAGSIMYLSDEGGKDWQYEFPHVGIRDGDIIKVGHLSLEVIYTPGHTPESVSFLLRDHIASEVPVMIFTGDFVFVGDVGRPDLLEKAAGKIGTQEVGASQMYESLKIFRQLPDFIQVWPGHGAGSACGRSLGSISSSTTGYEKIRNWAFQYDDDREGFISNLLDGQPEPPKYFAMMKNLNKVSRLILPEIPKHGELDKEEFLKNYYDGVKVIDTRDKKAFAQGFIARSINIPGNNAFSTWMGWVLNYQESFILIADADEMDDLTRKLMRIGLDNILGYVQDIQTLGLPLQIGNIIEEDEFKNQMGRDDVQILDTRNLREYEAGHIKGADNVFVGTILENLDKINKYKTLIVHCQSGNRATIAYSLLLREGFSNIKNYLGGMNDWVNKGNPVERV